MKIGQIVNLISELKSFSWADGLYVVIRFNTNEEVVELCRIEADYSLQQFDDGRPMTTCVGIRNKGIHPTKMTYNLNN